jgi:hypothetical protein
MNYFLRFVYLLLGVAGLGLLAYQVIETFPDVNPMDILVITIPDLLFFFLAYRTYPVESVSHVQRSYQQRKVSDY